MCQDCPVTLDLEVEQQVIEVHQFLLEGVLEQDVLAGHRYQVIGRIFLVKVLVHAVLGAQGQFNFEASVGNGILEFEKRVGQRLTRVLEGDSGDM